MLAAFESLSTRLSLARSSEAPSLSLSPCDAQSNKSAFSLSLSYTRTLPTFAVSRLAPSSTKMAPREAAAAAAASSSGDMGGARPPTMICFVLCFDAELEQRRVDRCLISASERGAEKNVQARSDAAMKERCVFCFFVFFLPSSFFVFSLFVLRDAFPSRERSLFARFSFLLLLVPLLSPLLTASRP